MNGKTKSRHEYKIKIITTTSKHLKQCFSIILDIDTSKKDGIKIIFLAYVIKQISILVYKIIITKIHIILRTIIKILNILFKHLIKHKL